MADKIKPVVLLILDGLGIDVPGPGNAVTLAKTPNLDRLWQEYCHTSLQASQQYVGLPEGVMGNSEVGHMTIGAGRILKQELVRIDDAIANGEFFENPVFRKLIDHVVENNSKIHFFGLLSTGRVHSSDAHVHACLEMCERYGIRGDRVVVHAFTDGRDTPPTSAKTFFDRLQAKMDELKTGIVGTITGRYYAMDRDERWDRIEMTYNAMFMGQGLQARSWQEALDASYARGETDEFVKSTVIVDETGNPVGSIGQNDAVICYDFRADRVVQISQAIENADFMHFATAPRVNMLYAGFSNYKKGAEEGGDMTIEEMDAAFPKLQLFPPLKPEHTLGQVVSEAGLKQLRLSESEKFPHVTYFFNNRKNSEFPGEHRIEVPSPREVSNYDQKPEMSTYEVTAKALEELDKGEYSFALINFANTDLVGHTSNIPACIRAVEVADECMGRIVDKVLELDGEIIVTADHGNVEELINKTTGKPDTSHSLNPVPLVYATKRHSLPVEVASGTIADLAPTLLKMMQLPVPVEMTGRDLFEGAK
jgi:2,3-bisphosphoglycerate-independent phosphoglycerate mutase